MKVINFYIEQRIDTTTKFYECDNGKWFYETYNNRTDQITELGEMHKSWIESFKESLQNAST